MSSSDQALTRWSSIFRDDFNSFDSDAWNLPQVDDSFIGQTQLRINEEINAPIVRNGELELILETYNPTNKPNMPSFYGSEIRTAESFSVNHGLAAEARVRLPESIQRGIVNGFFGYQVDPAEGEESPLHDEITFETLTNDIDDALNDNTAQRIRTNIYNEEPVNSVGNLVEEPSLPSTNVQDFVTLRFEWYPDHVIWFVDGNEIRREEVSTVIPDEALDIRFNIWVPKADGFIAAYDESLQPTENPADNETFSFFLDSVTIQRLFKVFSGTSGNERIAGTEFEDIIQGLSGNDRLLGRSGNDLLLGGSGNDRALGGDGDDQIVGNAGDDRLVGGAGTDTLLGGAGEDTLIGGTDNDRLLGAGGNDLMRGNLGDDVLNGGAGNDRLFGGAGNDSLNGQGGDDVIRGGAGNDVIRGGVGNDRLAGELGNDRIETGDGRDRIVIRPGQGRDIVTDFADGFDRIVLGNLEVSDLRIRQQGNDVLIRGNGERLLLLKNTQREQINAEDFA